MARASFSGTLRVGLIAIDVKAYATVTEDRTYDFHYMHRTCATRLKEVLVCPACALSPEGDDKVKGIQIGENLLMFSEQEMATLKPEKSDMEVVLVTNSDNIDPLWKGKSYFLVPSDNAAARSYGLLGHTLRTQESVAIIKFVSRGKDHVAALVPSDHGLMLVQMYFHRALRSLEADYEWKPAPLAFTPQELSLAKQFVETMRTPFDYSTIEDAGEVKVKAAIEAKLKQEPIPLPAQAPPPQNIISLMEALERSLAARGVQADFAAKEVPAVKEPAKVKKRKAAKRSGRR